MTQRCRICSHSNRLEIDKALIQGESYQNLAKKYDVSAQSIGRHMKSHLSRQLITAAEKSDLLHSEGLLKILEDLLQTSYMVISEAWKQKKLQIALNGIGQARSCAETVAKIVWALREQDLIREEREKPVKITVTLRDEEGNEIVDMQHNASSESWMVDQPKQPKQIEYRRRNRHESVQDVQAGQVDKDFQGDQGQDSQGEQIDEKTKLPPRRFIHYEGGIMPARQRRSRKRVPGFLEDAVRGSIRVKTLR